MRVVGALGQTDFTRGFRRVAFDVTHNLTASDFRRDLELAVAPEVVRGNHRLSLDQSRCIGGGFHGRSIDPLQGLGNKRRPVQQRVKAKVGFGVCEAFYRPVHAHTWFVRDFRQRKPEFRGFELGRSAILGLQSSINLEHVSGLIPILQIPFREPLPVGNRFGVADRVHHHLQFLNFGRDDAPGHEDIRVQISRKDACDPEVVVGYASPTIPGPQLCGAVELVSDGWERQRHEVGPPLGLSRTFPFPTGFDRHFSIDESGEANAVDPVLSIHEEGGTSRTEQRIGFLGGHFKRKVTTCCGRSLSEHDLFRVVRCAVPVTQRRTRGVANQVCCNVRRMLVVPQHRAAIGCRPIAAILKRARERANPRFDEQKPRRIFLSFYAEADEEEHQPDLH